MMLAYRRGLLEPDYKYGIQSMAREKLILEMLAMEQAAEASFRSLTLQCTAVAPAIRPGAASEFASGFKNPLARITNFAEYNPFQPDEGRFVKAESTNLVKAFNMLKERGIIEEFRKTAQKAVENLQEES